MLQDRIDAALHQGPSEEVWIPRVVAREAAALWEEAALLAEDWGATAEHGEVAKGPGKTD